MPLRKDWEKVKEAIMKEVLVAKFTQYDDTKKTLLSTGDKTLVEHTKNDSYQLRSPLASFIYLICSSLFLSFSSFLLFVFFL